MTDRVERMERVERTEQVERAQRFAGRVALITGASSGIGMATALAFAAEGARVVLAARRDDRCASVLASIRERGGEGTFVRTDVTDPAAVEAMVAHALATYGRLDCAFNNAGISGPTNVDTADHALEQWRTVLDVNLTGTWLSMKHEIPAMLAGGGGAIVNNSSVYGLVGTNIGNVPYSASKHGVLGLTRTAAYEYGKRGIRVNAVCPGYVHTEMVDPALAAIPRSEAFIRARTPMDRIADPEEIARGVLWLCSDDASFVTGQALTLDGGWTAV